MQIKVTYTQMNVTTPRQVVSVYRVAPFGIPSGITNDVLTEAGSMIVALGASNPSETGAPSADGQVWISNLSLPKKGYWGSVGGGGGEIELTNKSGGNLTAGTVVIMDSGNDESFITTSTLQDRRVIGVMTEDIANNSSGSVAVGCVKVTVKVQGNVSRGQWLIASATTGRAQASGYTKPLGSIGIALNEYTGGGAGTVTALIIVDHYLGASASKGYSLGGSNNTPSAVTTSQVLTMASETVAVVAGAALGAVRSAVAAAYTTDKGISYGGCSGIDYTTGNATAYKTVFSTDTTSAVSSADLLAARTAGGTVSAPLAGYYCGGLSNVAYVATAYKTPWSTETTAAQASANLSANRAIPGGNLHSTTNGYFGGGFTGAAVTAITDRLVISTETTGALASGNLSTARSGPTCVINTTQGYWCGGNTAGAISNTTDKMPFSTETTAAVGGAALSTGRRRSSGNNGTSGYILGGTTLNSANDQTATSPVATTDKLNFSADTMAAASGANLSTSLSHMASMSA